MVTIAGRVTGVDLRHRGSARLLLLCLSLATVCLTGLAADGRPYCSPARTADVPHAAIEFKGAAEVQVGRLVGTVRINQQPARDVIVEVYEFRSGMDGSNLFGRRRISACLTGVAGRFSFPDLRPGKYLVRAGTRLPDELNGIYLVVNLVDEHAQPADATITLDLLPGT